MSILNMVSNARTQAPAAAPAVPYTGRLPSQPPEGVTLSEGTAEEMQAAMQGVIVEINATREKEEFVYTKSQARATVTYIVDITTGEAAPDTRTFGGVERLGAFLNLNGGGADYRAVNAAWLDLQKKIAMHYTDVPLGFGFTITADKKIAITDGEDILTNEQKAAVAQMANQSKALVDSAVKYAEGMIDFVARDSVAGVGKFGLDFSNFQKTIDIGLILNTDEIGRQKLRAGHVGTAGNPLTLPGYHSNLWIYQLERNAEVRYQIEEREIGSQPH